MGATPHFLLTHPPISLPSPLAFFSSVLADGKPTTLSSPLKLAPWLSLLKLRLLLIAVASVMPATGVELVNGASGRDGR